MSDEPEVTAEEQVEPVAPAADGPPPAPPEPEAVVIHKHVDEQGNISAIPELRGGISPLEVETLIKLGLKKWQGQLGL